VCNFVVWALSAVVDCMTVLPQLMEDRLCAHAGRTAALPLLTFSHAHAPFADIK
jgi:hypothetical protein